MQGRRVGCSKSLSAASNFRPMKSGSYQALIRYSTIACAVQPLVQSRFNENGFRPGDKLFSRVPVGKGKELPHCCMLQDFT
jgi:hypothetical protein